MNIEILNKRQRYYKKPIIMFNLLESMRNKEVIFMDRKDNSKVVRCLFIRNTSMLDYFFNEFHFFEKDYNIYVSCADYRHIPVFTLNLYERSGQTRKWFQEQSRNEIIKYDILLDFDSNIKDFIDMKEEVITILLFIIDHELNFNVYPSGDNYQIVIKNNIYNFKEVGIIIENIKEMFNTTFLDLKGAGVHNKIRKCEYSLVKDKVCLPIRTLGDLIKTNYNNFDCNIIMRNVRLKNRGLCLSQLPFISDDKNTKLKRFVGKYLLLQE